MHVANTLHKDWERGRGGGASKGLGGTARPSLTPEPGALAMTEADALSTKERVRAKRVPHMSSRSALMARKTARHDVAHTQACTHTHTQSTHTYIHTHTSAQAHMCCWYCSLSN